MLIERAITVLRAMLYAGLLIGGMAASTGSFAQAYPSKAVRVIVPFPPGSPPDVAARIVAAKMGPHLGQPVVVDNKPGASGTIALGELAHQPADGYTLLVLPNPTVSIISLYPNPPLDLRKDIVPIGQIDWSYNVLVVAPTAKYNSVADLVAEMKAHPGKLSYASGGYGTPAHLVAAQLLLQTNTSAVHVPYNQFSQTLGDVATGRVDFMVLNAPSAVPQVASGRLKALAITSPKRNPALPDVPSFAEIGLPEVAVRGWDGLVALKGTPPDVVARLGKELSLALADKDLQKEMLRSQTEPAPSDAATFAKLIDDELAHWEVVVKKANIRLDK